MWSAIKSALTGDSDRRVAPRVAALGTVTIDSTKFTLENWSLSGILISGHDGRLVKGQKFKMTVDVRDDDRAVVFTAEAVVVRVSGDKLAAHFHHIDKQKKQAIAEYFAHKTGQR